MAILMPALFGVVGLVIDGGLVMSNHRQLQGAADAAALAAAVDLRLGKSAGLARSTAVSTIVNENQLADTVVIANIPPTSGLHAGRPDHVEVIATRNYRSKITQLLDSVFDRSIQVRSVAGVNEVTAGAAMVILDPDPSPVTLPALANLFSDEANQNASTASADQSGAGDFVASVSVIGPLLSGYVSVSLEEKCLEEIAACVDLLAAQLPALNAPAVLAGLEVEGVGRLRVPGAIHVNNGWGGVDENYRPAGEGHGPPYGMACMPIVSTTKVQATEIRVAGGVDSPKSYGPFYPDGKHPLQANRLPVEDPAGDLPIPSKASDPSNVSGTIHYPGDLCRVALSADRAADLIDEVLAHCAPLLRPLFQDVAEPLTKLCTEVTIRPGVYNSITAICPAGGIRFEPGIYLIKGVSPLTGLSLTILGPVEAEGVMFYVTDSTGFDATTGTPDNSDNADDTPPVPVTSLAPSTLIAPLIDGAKISGLNDPSSPFDSLLVYQRRTDRRPIVIDAQQLVSASDSDGTIYAKWGHVLMIGGAGPTGLKIASGTARVVTAFDTVLEPSTLFPPAQDVLLVE